MRTVVHTILAKRKEARFWQYSCLFLTLLFTVTILYREISPPSEDKILLIGPNSYHLPKLQSFAEADQLHLDQAKIASLFLLQRSPNGLEYKERIKLLFGEEAYGKALKLVRAEQEEFRLKSLHQKVEIAHTKIMTVRDNSVLVSLKGQLIRTGNFEGQPFIESLHFDVKMTFIRNPNLIANGNYPTIVTDFEVHTTPTTSN